LAPGILLRAGSAGDFLALREVDDDAALLYEEAGLHLDLPDDHEFVLAERDHWRRSLADGSAIVAGDPLGRVVGFAAVTRIDGRPYLAQLSVRRTHMRRGLGSALLHAALDAARKDAVALWLTTYDHLPWNRAFYERHGFLRVEERDCGPGMQAELALERRALPAPGKRIAIYKDLRPR
jgi:GNAT superfamily N-acetyltransferase